MIPAGGERAENSSVFSDPKLAILCSCMAVALLSGCASGSSTDSAGEDVESPPHGDVVLEITTTPIPKTLPPTMCFVGVHDYDITILGESLEPANACGQLADRYFAGATHLPWPPTNLQDPDVVNECDLSRGLERVVISRADPDFEGPRFSRAYDLAESACESLLARGWTKTPYR